MIGGWRACRLAIGLALGFAMPSLGLGAQSYLPAHAAGDEPNGQETYAALDRLRKNPSPIGLRAILQGWEREFPGRITVETYGQSRAGRALVMVRIAPPALPGQTEPEAGQPAALLVPELGSEYDPTRFLGELYAWLHAPSQGVPYQLCVAVAPDPDGWIEGERAEDLERNFPIDWTPWCEAGGNPGTAPLSEPECKALARWSLGEPRLMGVVRWLPSQVGAFEREGAHGVSKQGTLGTYACWPGSLQRYATALWGVPVEVSAPSQLGTALLQLEVRRDRVGGQVQKVERLGQDLWVLDIEVHNVAQPHGSADAQRRSGPLDCTVTGGRVRAIALADGPLATGRGALQGPEPSFTLWAQATPPPLPPPGEGTLWRLVVETNEQDALFLNFASPRMHPFTLAAALPKDPARTR